MKQAIALLVAFIFASGCDDRTEIELFDRAQALWAESYAKQTELVNEYDRDLWRFSEHFGQMQKSYAVLERIAFIYKLRNDARAIDWSSPYSWSAPMQTKDYENFKTTDPDFRSEAEKYERLKSEVYSQEELFRRLNSSLKDHRTEMNAISESLHEKLMSLQREMEKRRKIG